ncbi:MAG: lipopolysaccharide biosynthesis protein [Gordonia sp. (in: high G+C Gram-positive bacteria)]|uniref:lipopolysaccharide biosynthesis protein n=1 Tax=Gordonia sp. (in: high G+C Gram-positive bacteria) TaxID=84139 RepID=UPI0039E3C13E
MTSDVSDADTGIGRNSLALTVSAALTAGLGLIYWIVMGRLYPPSEVGAASAVITAATMLANFGNLGLGAYFERFLPIAGDRRAALAFYGMLTATGFGLVLGIGFLFVGPADEMFANTTQRVLFPFFVVVLSGFALLDNVTIAMYRARWAAWKNIFHAVVKLVLAVVAAFFIGRTGMAGTWVVTAAVATFVVGWAAMRQLRDTPATTAETLPPLRDQLRFVVGNYAIFVVTALTPLILPMMVIGTVGADHNAYFAIVWSLLTSVIVLLTMLTGPYVAAASGGADLRSLTLRFSGILAAISVTAALGFIVVGPFVLTLAGSDYAAAGTDVLRIASLGLPLTAVSAIYTALCRVRRRLWPALVIQSVTAALMLGLTALWLPVHGIVSAGWAMLIAEGVGATVSGTLLVCLVIRSRTSDAVVSADDSSTETAPVQDSVS